MRALDIVLAMAALVALLPLFLLVSLLVLLVDGRPVFHGGERLGKQRVPFRHLKFRTMQAGPGCGRVFFEQERITRLGRLLRRTHLDELPELWLILRGRMAFVGPRPLPEALLAGLDDTVRRTVRPGWTGPAQLYLLRHGRLDKHLQLRLDSRYALRRGIGTDLCLLLATACLVLRGGKAPDLDPTGSAARRSFGNAYREGTETRRPRRHAGTTKRS